MSDGPTRPITLRDLAEIDVGRLNRVGEKRRAALGAVGIETVLDLLTTYPRRWIDRTNEASIASLAIGEEALVIAEVRSVNSRTTRNRRTMVSIVVGDKTGKISLVFFNQPWRARQLSAGMEVALFGRVDEYAGGRQMTNPIVDLIGDRTGRIVPVYPQSEKARLTTWEIAGWVEEALRRCAERGIADPVPEEVLDRLDLIDRAEAIRSIHQPESMRAKDAARRRLAFDELLRVQSVLV
ncbi:MAG: OB-fold nucleic acid binding domain-containing protein, partial [Ilumatobacteraceae bacterium]